MGYFEDKIWNILKINNITPDNNINFIDKNIISLDSVIDNKIFCRAKKCQLLLKIVNYQF